MLLTIRTTHRPATDLGYLLAKNPARAQVFELPFGKAHVFYPEVGEAACTAALLLEIDPLGLVRGPGATVSDYVNDRAYASSSFLSVAIARVLGSALGGKCRDRKEVAATPIPLEATLAAVPCRGDEGLAGRLFEPLGYDVTTDPEGEEARYRDIRLAGRQTVQALLNHIYVLLPVMDNRKHYWIGKAELEKLLSHGEGWLGDHPEQAFIVRRYLGHRKTLTTDATARLQEVSEGADEDEGAASEPETPERRRLHDLRLDWAVETLKAAGARRVVDLGCGNGKLLARLAAEPEFTEIVGADTAPRALEIAERRLKLRKRPEAERRRLRLLQTALTYEDPALAGFDAAAVVEVVEHIEPERVPAFEEALFGRARPGTVALTTPNREYNVRFPQLGKGGLRHGDHRFEWTREEFTAWAAGVAKRHGYRVETGGLGAEEEGVGSPSQKAVFTRCN